MKSNIFLKFLFLIFLIASCTEDYKLPNLGSKTTIVITGLVTNEPGPYFVKIMENVSDISTGQLIHRGINDARVTIFDNNGNVDLLRSFYSVPTDSTLEYSGINYYGIPYEGWNYTLEIPDGIGGFRKFSFSKYFEGENLTSTNYDVREGTYFTTSTKGIVGNKYTLKVEYKGYEYKSTDYMCYGTVIDSVSVEPIGKFMYDKPDGWEDFLVPCLYFAEPQDEVNFYMFREFGYLFSSELSYINSFSAKDLIILGNIYLGGSTSNEEWLISVVSDRFMSPYVYQYKMSDGDCSDKNFSGTDMGFAFGKWDKGGLVNMYCISEPVYRYYAALSKQFYNDGGAFSPAPASPPTNISGGAQGCFSAASVSQYFLDLSDNDKK